MWLEIGWFSVVKSLIFLHKWRTGSSLAWSTLLLLSLHHHPNQQERNSLPPLALQMYFSVRNSNHMFDLLSVSSCYRIWPPTITLGYWHPVNIQLQKWCVYSYWYFTFSVACSSPTVTRVCSQGHVKLNLNVVTKDLWKQGYRNGSSEPPLSTQSTLRESTATSAPVDRLSWV